MHKTDRLRAFTESFATRYAKYHDHKEKMVYAAFAVYAGSFAAGVLSPRWPPPWIVAPWPRLIIAAILATCGWGLALWFIGWQLRRRRLAALRVAAAERLLLKWLTLDPSESDFEPAPKVVPPAWRLSHFLWPPTAPLPEADVEEARFPIALVREWRSQAAWPGTAATFHEHGIIGVGWAFWLALIVKAAIVSCAQAA